jgi:hypothetical protein
VPPPGEYTRRVAYARTGDMNYEDGADRFGAWLWDEGVLHVWFDAAGRVEEAEYSPNPTAPTALTALRDWVGW